MDTREREFGGQFIDTCICTIFWDCRYLMQIVLNQCFQNGQKRVLEWGAIAFSVPQPKYLLKGSPD